MSEIPEVDPVELVEPRPTFVDLDDISLLSPVERLQEHLMEGMPALNEKELWGLYAEIKNYQTEYNTLEARCHDLFMEKEMLVASKTCRACHSFLDRDFTSHELEDLRREFIEALDRLEEQERRKPITAGSITKLSPVMITETDVG